jgi:hypothetical protein
MGRLAEAAAPTLFALDDVIQPQLIPVEINLEGFPLFSREKTPSERAIEVRQNSSTLDGRTLKQLWRVTANEDFSLPDTYDEDVFVGVMALVKRRGGMPKNGSVLRGWVPHRLAPPREPHRMALLGRRPLLWDRDRRRGVRDLCAPHESRLSSPGSGVVLADGVDLGSGVRPNPSVPAPSLP